MYKGDLRLQIPFFHQNMSVLSYMKHLKTRKIQILTQSSKAAKGE